MDKEAKFDSTYDSFGLSYQSYVKTVCIDEQMEKETEEYDALGEELDNLTGSGRIEVQGIAYPGVKLTISNVKT